MWKSATDGVNNRQIVKKKVTIPVQVNHSPFRSALIVLGGCQRSSSDPCFFPFLSSRLGSFLSFPYIFRSRSVFDATNDGIGERERSLGLRITTPIWSSPRALGEEMEWN